VNTPPAKPLGPRGFCKLKKPLETNNSPAVVLLNKTGYDVKGEGMETMILRIIKARKGLALPLPEDITEALQLTEGSEVTVSVDPEKKQILIQSLRQSTDLGDINLEFAEQVSTFIRDYKPALEELAKLEE